MIFAGLSQIEFGRAYSRTSRQRVLKLWRICEIGNKKFWHTLQNAMQLRNAPRGSIKKKSTQFPDSKRFEPRWQILKPGTKNSMQIWNAEIPALVSVHGHNMTWMPCARNIHAQPHFWKLKKCRILHTMRNPPQAEKHLRVSSTVETTRKR